MKEQMNEVVIDVRERDEFRAERIESAINIPLSCFPEVAPGVLKHLEGREIVLLCRSGGRAKLALGELNRLGGFTGIKASVYEGGILEWKRKGQATLSDKRYSLPIMRQVQLIAGLGVFSTTLLGVFIDPRFLWGSAFFGLGLSIAGATGFCGLALLLEKMPWNRSKPKAACCT